MDDEELLERLTLANTGPCEVSAWSEWSVCSHPCTPSDVRDAPYQWRVRQVTKRGDIGLPCPNLYESRPCQPAPPPCTAQDCVMGAWSDWSPCSGDGGTLSCGAGTAFRHRAIVTAPSGVGARPCEPTVAFEACTRNACQVGCRTEPWGPWSECSETCGGGRQSRTRVVHQPSVFGALPACGDVAANTHPREERDCNTHSCGNDCVLGPWQRFGDCAGPCGGVGTQLWIRPRIAEATAGRTPCPPPDSPQRHEYRPCTTAACAAQPPSSSAVPGEPQPTTTPPPPAEPPAPPPDEPIEPPAPPPSSGPGTQQPATDQPPSPPSSGPGAAPVAALSAASLEPPPAPWPVIGGVLAVMVFLALALLSTRGRTDSGLGEGGSGGGRFGLRGSLLWRG
jgi:hypothetical protein